MAHDERLAVAVRGDRALEVRADRLAEPGCRRSYSRLTERRQSVALVGRSRLVLVVTEMFAMDGDLLTRA